LGSISALVTCYHLKLLSQSPTLHDLELLLFFRFITGNGQNDERIYTVPVSNLASCHRGYQTSGTLPELKIENCLYNKFCFPFHLQRFPCPLAYGLLWPFLWKGENTFHALLRYKFSGRQSSKEIQLFKQIFCHLPTAQVPDLADSISCVSVLQLNFLSGLILSH